MIDFRTLSDKTPPPAPAPAFAVENELEYAILVDETASALARVVNDHIAVGWTPLGQPMSPREYCWYQAMIREPG